MEAKYNMIIELAQQQGLTHIQLTQKHCLHLAASVGKLCSGVVNNAKQKIKTATGEIFTLLTIINHQIQFDEDELTLDECLDEFLKNKHCLNEFSIHKE
ncbi:hypothetical protein P2L49_12745 [Mannheimia haemolytica]|nr:hypothetical protein [Mannheimia haemolytica]